MDCVDGYHVVELAMEERHKMTFATDISVYHKATYPLGTVIPKTYMQYRMHAPRNQLKLTLKRLLIILYSFNATDVLQNLLNAIPLPHGIAFSP